MDKIKQLTSDNLVDNNIEALKQLFPTAFSEGKVVMEELQALLGDYVEKDKEYYEFNWAGKHLARQEANKVSTGTLRPCKEESKDWDTTGNLVIEGDNLEVLKLLQKTYSNKVKMIYIDPPYNTGKDFVYKDNYKDNLSNYLELTGQTDDEGRKLSSNTDSDGRYHSNWLNMMYPRLKLARNLLTDDGVIFISIDDNEQANLKKVCDEIFGEENFVANVPRIAKRTSNKGTHFRPTKDYVLVYAKSISNLPEFGIEKERDEKDYNLMEENGRKYKQSGASLFQPSLDSRPNQRYYIKAPDGSLIIPPGDIFPEIKEDASKIKPLSNNDKVWRWSVDTYLKQKHLLIFTKGSARNPLLDENGNQSKWNIYPKVYYDEDIKATLYPEDVIYGYPNSQSTKELNDLEIPFSFAKPTNLIKYILKLVTNDNDIILDFFAGSSSTAHATMQLNGEDYGSRKFIMVQLPEPIDENQQSYKAGFTNIAEITKERIRRAGELIKKEHKDKEGIENLDVGFRVFKLDSSNIKRWDTAPDSLEQQLDMFDEAIKSDRTEEDMLYEILLKYGLDLTTPIAEKVVDGCTIYNVGFGSLYVCLSENIQPMVAQAIADWHKEFEDNNPNVIFSDSGFNGNDAAKTNAVQTLRQMGIENVRSI